MAERNRARHVGAIAAIEHAEIHGDEIALLQPAVAGDAVRHTGVRAGDDDRVEGQPLRAVFVQAVDQLGAKLLLRHALMDAGADLGEGAVGDVLRLLHTLQLPGLLAVAEDVDLLLDRNEFGVEALFKAAQLADGGIILLEAERVQPELREQLVDDRRQRTACAEIHDREAGDVLLRRLDIAAVGDVIGAVPRDDGIALGDVKFGGVHAAVARCQEQTLHIVGQDGAVFFKICHGVSSCFLQRQAAAAPKDAAALTRLYDCRSIEPGST